MVEVNNHFRISVVIPTYQRELVLVETIKYLLASTPAPDEILIVDQTENHDPDTQNALLNLETTGSIRRIRLDQPSITHAMNVGLEHANSEIALFVDDDIIPGPDLISAHIRAHAANRANIVAGQVLQPGEEPMSLEPERPEFRFCSSAQGYVSELMGGNFSIRRAVALRLGGFDENFVHAAYRFEAEFAARALVGNEKIWFEPNASIRHLKANTGGTRSYGEHLKSIKPSHSVGAYYYLIRSNGISRRFLKVLARPVRAIRTRHHLSHPWWIPATILAELSGLIWAVALALRGPRLINRQ